MRSALCAATLALFDLRDQQLLVEEHLFDEIASFFSCVESTEVETKVVRLAQPEEEELSPALLPYTSTNLFLPIELENILAADPRVYPSFLLLIAITLHNPPI